MQRENYKFSDDILRFSQNENELQNMLKELKLKTEKAGQETKTTKNKDHNTLNIQGPSTEKVEPYIYL